MSSVCSQNVTLKVKSSAKAPIELSDLWALNFVTGYKRADLAIQISKAVDNTPDHSSQEAEEVDNTAAGTVVAPLPERRYSADSAPLATPSSHPSAASGGR